MSFEITWNKNIEPQNKVEIKKHLESFIWLVPQWCQQIHINLFGESGQDSSIETKVDYAYRFIQIDFYTTWLNLPDETKQVDIVHELIHGFVNVLHNQAYRNIKTICGNNEILKDVVLDELCKTVESVTQDLSFVIYNKFNERTT